MSASVSLTDSLDALREPLLALLLERAVNTSPEIERVLCRVRSQLLRDATQDGLSLHLEQGVGKLLATLAQQSFLNEYAWYETPEERQQVRELTADVAKCLNDDDMVDRGKLALLGAYRPLHTLPFAAQVLRHYEPGSDDFLYKLIRLQLIGPLHDRALRHEIVALTPIDDPTSRSVQQQYEENPYPRWLHLDHHAPQSIPDYLRSVFPHLEPGKRDWPAAPRVLVAGCGTGKQAISAAMRFCDAQVLGVDLSQTSLAYARRMSAELNVGNVEYRHGDLLKLPSDLAPFDIVECVGVLHHLRDPDAGLRALVEKLRPGGLIRIGLYSERARRILEPARALVRERGFAGDLDGIRAFRNDVLQRPTEDPVTMILNAADFYSTSECRDLIFHVCEHEFSLARIGPMLRNAGLRLLGFELANENVLEAYRKRFPADHAMSDMQCWAQFEHTHPSLFASMYQFWALRDASPVQETGSAG